jgi:hypothetical protein
MALRKLNYPEGTFPSPGQIAIGGGGAISTAHIGVSTFPVVGRSPDYVLGYAPGNSVSSPVISPKGRPAPVTIGVRNYISSGSASSSPMMGVE